MFCWTAKQGSRVNNFNCGKNKKRRSRRRRRKKRKKKKSAVINSTSVDSSGLMCPAVSCAIVRPKAAKILRDQGSNDANSA